MPDDQEVGMQELFWLPDLVEKLLPFLDAASTLCLAQSKISCILQMLQRSSVVWDKMVRRTLPGELKIMYSLDNEGLWNLDSEEHSNKVRESFQEKRVELLSLIDILKMMVGAKFQKLHLLLDVISEKSSPDCALVPSIKISCPCHGSKSVSTLGFLLLEEVEGALGSTLQELVWMVSPPTALGYLQEPLLSALASRVSRQNKVIERMEVWWVKITTKESAEALFTLVQNTDTVGYTAEEEGMWRRGVWRLKVSGNIEADGWAAIARALALIPDCFQSLIASKEVVREGRGEDLRTVWESLSLSLDVGDDEFYQKFFKSNGEASWIALEKILDN